MLPFNELWQSLTKACADLSTSSLTLSAPNSAKPESSTFGNILQKHSKKAYRDWQTILISRSCKALTCSFLLLTHRRILVNIGNVWFLETDGFPTSNPFTPAQFALCNLLEEMRWIPWDEFYHIWIVPWTTSCSISLCGVDHLRISPDDISPSFVNEDWLQRRNLISS